jgi:hypothetical protein
VVGFASSVSKSAPSHTAWEWKYSLTTTGTNRNDRFVGEIVKRQKIGDDQVEICCHKIIYCSIHNNRRKPLQGLGAPPKEDAFVWDPTPTAPVSPELLDVQFAQRWPCSIQSSLRPVQYSTSSSEKEFVKGKVKRALEFVVPMIVVPSMRT